MKYLFISLFMLFCSVAAFSQIKTLEEKKDMVAKPVIPVYDATVNYLPKKDLKQYIGQVFYMAKVTDRTGYYRGHLYVENPKKKKNAPALIEGKRYWDAMGRYYDVIGIEGVDRYGLDEYLILRDKEDGTVYYYKYSGLEMFFPFVVVSYFEKMSKKMVGDTLYFEGRDINAYRVGEKELEPMEMAPFICTDYVLDETGKDWKEVLLLESDSVKLKIPMRLAIQSSKSDMAFNAYIRDKKYSEKIMKRNAEEERQEKVNIEKTFSEANKLIGTTIYPFNNSGYCWVVDSVGAEEGDEKVDFKINTPLKVVSVGRNENDKFHAILYFTTSDGKMYMRSVCFHSRIDNNYFHAHFSTVDIRKQHKNISEKRWNQIQRGVTELGMTLEECDLVKGRAPESISSIETAQGSTTIVRYYKSNLYFRNGILVAIHD